jgi:hypothetical protein
MTTTPREPTTSAKQRAARQQRVIQAEVARHCLTQLKASMATLAELEEWDHHYDLLHDLLDWGHKTAGHLGTRHGGYLVVLDRGLRDEDTVLIMRFLLNIAGVIAVDPVPENAGMHVAERRALYRMRDAIEEAIRDA